MEVVSLAVELAEVGNYEKTIQTYLLLFLITFSCKNNTDVPLKTNQAVVQDYTSLFSNTEKSALAQKIIDYESSSTNEICIYTIDSLPKNTKSLYYATEIANKLGVGKKEKDNGLLILISKYDRQINMATGYSTEKIITDRICKSIIDSTIVPKFKDKEYYHGVNNALDSIIKFWK